MSGAAPLLLPCAFVAWVGTALPLLACFTLSYWWQKKTIGFSSSYCQVTSCCLLVNLEFGAAFTDWIPCVILQLCRGALVICLSGFMLGVHGISCPPGSRRLFPFFLTCLLQSWSNLWCSILGWEPYFFSLFYMLVCIICWASTLISVTWSTGPVLLLPTQSLACSCVS